MNTTYDSLADAENDGWVRSAPTGWKTLDISAPGSYGYDKAAVSPDGTRRVTTTAVWIRDEPNRMGKPGVMFNLYRADDFEC